ncbi:yeats family-domain-containing protein [Bisporella sp. PMI_857]|nr:yeats family-domain-containing protein [Bisporella sp. PMI_857]
MAPPNTQKRIKGTAISRPFVYGTTAREFDEVTNPRPADVPAEHTHSWTVFVKGVDDADITYWLKKVQFKLHETIANSVRTIENVAPGEPFETHATGWGQFEITIKFYYIPEANEKAQALYHLLRLHPYGDEKQQNMQKENKEVTSWCYEEMVWNEPYENFYEIMTTPTQHTNKGGKGGAGKGTKLLKGGMVASAGDRTAQIPLGTRPGQPFSRETEAEEIKRLKVATATVEEQIKAFMKEKEEIEAETAKVRASM